VNSDKGFQCAACPQDLAVADDLAQVGDGGVLLAQHRVQGAQDGALGDQ
jgi:hypothetical protein